MSYAFDEDRYRPARRFVGPYLERVMTGRGLAAASNVAICGLARDIGPHLGHSLAGMEAIAGLFSDHRFFLFENDSVDGTRERLADWRAADPDRRWVRSESRNATKWGPVRSAQRGDQMAAYRAAYHAAAIEQAPDFDYAIVVDVDLGAWSLDGVASTIGSAASGWDMMGGNGLAVVRGQVVQYDAWAWRDVAGPTPLRADQVNHRVFDRGHPPVPVFSCFGGIAVYKMDAFKAGRYSGGDCEHVPFHSSMAGSGFDRAFCNPGMVAVYR